MTEYHAYEDIPGKWAVSDSSTGDPRAGEYLTRNELFTWLRSRMQPGDTFTWEEL